MMCVGAVQDKTKNNNCCPPPKKSTSLTYGLCLVLQLSFIQVNTAIPNTACGQEWRWKRKTHTYIGAHLLQQWQ